jgi:hypothetical protein
MLASEMFWILKRAGKTKRNGTSRFRRITKVGAVSWLLKPRPRTFCLKYADLSDPKRHLLTQLLCRCHVRCPLVSQHWPPAKSTLSRCNLKRIGLINQVWGNEIHISYNSNLKTSTIPFIFVMKWKTRQNKFVVPYR